MVFYFYSLLVFGNNLFFYILWLFIFFYSSWNSILCIIEWLNYIFRFDNFVIKGCLVEGEEVKVGENGDRIYMM